MKKQKKVVVKATNTNDNENVNEPIEMQEMDRRYKIKEKDIVEIINQQNDERHLKSPR